MRDYLTWGTTPHDEPCVQIKDPHSQPKSRIEARVLIRQLHRQFGEPPEGVWFEIGTNYHDFGVYPDLRLSYNDENPKHERFVFRVDEQFPTKWDATARKELDEAMKRFETDHNEGEED